MKKLLLLGIVLSSVNAFGQKYPVAVNDTFVVHQNSTNNTLSVTEYDTFYVGTMLAVYVVTPPTHGTASVINDDQVNYTPKPYYFGTDLFTYSACDSLNHCDTGTVYLNVTGMNYPPVTVTTTFMLNDSTNTAFLKADSNDYSPEGWPIKVDSILNSDTLLGTVSLDTNGMVLFTRRPLSCGTDSLQYLVCDSLDTCSTGTVYLVIDCPDAIFRPQGISPNGDGINDALVFTNLEYFSPATLKVFNRWGNVVYENDNYQNDWKGTNRFTNEDLPDGTYFYQLSLPNNRQYTSYLIINR